MRVVVLDEDELTRATVCSRLEEALRQADLRRAELIEGDIDSLSVLVAEDPPQIGFLGPGCYHRIEDHIARFRVVFPEVPLALILTNELYTASAVDLRKVLNIRIIPMADIVQMAQFVLDVGSRLGPETQSQNRGVITLTQFKGGVGGTTLAASLAACWAHHGLSTVILDLDDLNPHLSDWAKAALTNRRMLAEALRSGKLLHSRMQEVLAYHPSFENRLAVVPQPEHYGESFHFKADVLEDAPSSASFIESLIPQLQDEFDIVLIDSGRSWGISTFASLSLSHRVLMVTDDDRTSLRRTLNNFARVYRESDDSQEFDLRKWGLVINACTGDTLRPDDVTSEIGSLELFPRLIDLHLVPFSNLGRDWSAGTKSLYDLADGRCRKSIIELACSLVPFQHAHSESSLTSFLKRSIGRISL